MLLLVYYCIGDSTPRCDLYYAKDGVALYGKKVLIESKGQCVKVKLDDWIRIKWVRCCRCRCLRMRQQTTNGQRDFLSKRTDGGPGVQ